MAQAQGGKGGANSNVFDASSAAMQGGVNATQQAGQGFANVYASPGNNYKTNYEAAQMANPGAIRAGMQKYQNPWENKVINNAQRDLRQQTQMGLRDIGAQAAGMGAFGGSRQGIMEGQAIGEASRAAGDLSSSLRAQGFNTAAGLAGQDIANQMGANQFNANALNTQKQFKRSGQAARANNATQTQLAALSGLLGAGQTGFGQGQTGFGIGQGASDRVGQNGEAIRQQQQQLMDQASQYFNQYANYPMNSTGDLLSLLSGNPMSNTGQTTMTNNPGLKTQLQGWTGFGSRIPGG